MVLSLDVLKSTSHPALVPALQCVAVGFRIDDRLDFSSSRDNSLESRCLSHEARTDLAMLPCAAFLGLASAGARARGAVPAALGLGTVSAR